MASKPLSSGLTSRPSLSVPVSLSMTRGMEHLSSGLTSRPSLSGARRRHGGAQALAVVGVNLPTFVERAAPPLRRVPRPPPVVGVNLPTFVERHNHAFHANRPMPLSSGLTSRPSLSADLLRRVERRAASVVGVNLPTFVERRRRAQPQGAMGPVVGVNLPTFVERACCPLAPADTARLSSGLTSRPSLSGRVGGRAGGGGALSSGLTSRPSLSVDQDDEGRQAAVPVVGVNLPTFVERPSLDKRVPTAISCRRG